MSELSMWLYPVALAGAIGFFYAVREGIKWTWGLALQEGLIVLASAIGLFFLYAPVAAELGIQAEFAAQVATVFAWLCFLGFNVGPRFVVGKLNLDICSFKMNEARRQLPLMKLLVWGPPAKFWCSAVDAMDLYSQGRKAEADSLLEAPLQNHSLPWQCKESLVTYLMLGSILQQEWHSAINIFRENLKSFRTTSTMSVYLVMRAYAELGEFERAIAAVEIISSQPQKQAATTLDISFMTFFALAGARKHLDYIFDVCRDHKALPSYVRKYWLGRCYASEGETSKAIETFTEAKLLMPASATVWHERVEGQLQRQSEIQLGLREITYRIASVQTIEKAHDIYSRWRLAADLLRPTQTRLGVKAMLIGICLAYVITNPEQFFPVPALSELFVAFHRATYSSGQLEFQRFMAGDWWRIITYMFLHGNLPHLLLNAGALYLFGRSVENIYGTPRFFLIYILAGLLSGFGQVLLLPDESAIGASGAILGVFGAAIAATIKLKNVIDKQTRKTELRWMLTVAGMQIVFDQLINGVASLTDKTNSGIRIASFAHIGGMLVGFIIGMLLPTRTWAELSGDSLRGEELNLPTKAK